MCECVHVCEHACMCVYIYLTLKAPAVGTFPVTFSWILSWIIRWAGMLLINTWSFFYLELTDKTGPSLPILADTASVWMASILLVPWWDSFSQNLFIWRAWLIYWQVDIQYCNQHACWKMWEMKLQASFLIFTCPYVRWVMCHYNNSSCPYWPLKALKIFSQSAPLVWVM